MLDGPGADPPFDRGGRDPYRHPMQWDASPNGGFTTGTPWLPPIDPQERNVEAQQGDRDSLLEHYRRLISERDGADRGLILPQSGKTPVPWQRSS
jgi:alpha-glucosidase